MLALTLALTLAAASLHHARPSWRVLTGFRDARQSPDESCVGALDSLVRVLRRDYPGYRDQVVGDKEDAFAALIDSVRIVVITPAADTSYEICIPALQRVTRFFRDAHLMLWQGPPPPVRSSDSGASAGAAARPSAQPPVSRDDPERPMLRRFDARTLVLSLPNLDMRYKSAMDSLVASHRAELTAKPRLVIDLRGDGGGCTCTYEPLLPLIATGAVADGPLDVWASPANVAYFRELASDVHTPETLKAELRRLLPRLEAAPNTFVAWNADTTAAVYRPPAILARPTNVAVLVDSICASSCENFVMVARQSRKVTVFSATNTAGAGDYGNVRQVMLPGWRRLRVATSRASRLRTGAQSAIDFVGLAPDVRLPRDSAAGDAAIVFAFHHLRPADSSKRSVRPKSRPVGHAEPRSPFLGGRVLLR
ncbi:MAG TPA: hypothetical protein VJT68_00445 [Thermoleophilaceae bacterium]|nr:hypothetical protein [Thermoleophilaceae bacterium]